MVRKTVAFATSRGLCDVRDVAVVIEVIDKLHAECKDQRETDLLYSARNVLVARRQQVAAGEQGLSAQAAQAADALSEAAERVASWPLATPGFDLLGPGIQKTYAKSRKAFTKAYREPSELAFTRYTRVLSIIGIKCTSLATSGRIGSAPIVGLLNHCLTS